ncbi:MAG: DNRLRE domain-containing protein, partial [Clostridiales bacterium]|nr:DNRLRE domain-containing protein [Clostridiales bacterium]
MKKVLKSGTKIVSVFLAALFVVQILPMSVFAEDFTQGGAEAVQGAESVGVQSQQSEGQAIVLAEDTSKREEYVKHFRMSDGSVKAVEYDVPVHFEQNGEWTDYDNTLTETDAEADENEGKLAKNKDLVNQSADYSVRLSKKTNGKKFVRLEKDGCKISWYYLNAEKVEASVADAADDGDETTLEKVSSVVRYSGVYKSTDFEYILGSQGLKENIILLDAKAPREFTAEYKTQGLTPVSLDDKTVELRNAAGETVYVISAPYMVDANGESAWGITLSIISVKNDTFQLKLSLDSAWLDSADRAYPVTADPYLQTEQGWNELTNCHSAYIASATPNARYGRGGSNYEGSLYVGKTNGRGVTRSLIKTSNLPALGVADKVIHAEYAFYVNACYPEMRMDMHRITSAWEQSTVCWNSNVTYDNKIIDYQIVQYMETSNTTAERWQRFELTDLVRGWYSGEIPNNGVLLRSDYETSSSQKRVWMLSSGYTTYSGVRPLLIIHYRNMSGYEDYWSYTSVSAGRNGVASVNNYNGNLIFSQPVTQDDGGNLMPVALSVIYNQNANNAPYTQVGYNVQTNYHLYVRPESAAVSERGYKYYFNDADGTHHSFYFENGNTTHGTDEDGLGYSLDVVQGGYCITDKSGTTMNFNSAGNLTMITNASGVSSTVEYETAEEILRIKNIKDGAGRAYTFYYEAQYPGLCAKIVAPSGKETRFGYDFGCLRWITFADEKICELIYDSSRYVMTGIKSIDAMLVNFVTDSTNQKRVTQISCGTSETVLSEKYTLDYKQNATSVTDIKQRTYTYQFNDFAQTTGTVSSADGSAQFFKLGASGSGNMTNKLLSESRVLRSAENFIVNPGFTHADYTGYGTYTEPASGTSVSIDSSKKNFTANSLKIYKASSASGSVLSLQDVTSAPVGTYTLSAYINTNNATLAGDGAHLGVELRNSSGVIEEIAYIEKTVKTNGWERRCVTFTLQQGYSLRVVAGFSGASSGSVWFDDLQLERGAGESSFNLVENPAFTNGVNNWVSEPGVAPTLASSGNLTGYSYCGKIPGTVEGGNKNLIQSIPVSGSAGDVFAFGMWTKAFSAPVKNGTKNVDAYQPSYEIALHYYGTNGVWAGYAHLDCNADLRDTWQFTTEELIIPIAYSRIAIEIIYNYNVNDAYMTGAFCYKEQYGQTYTYDADGNAVSVADLAKTESEFAYYGNQMTKLLNPTGSKYFYTYNNSNKQLNYALSTDGQEYGFTYDNKGNATKAEISAREPAAALETGKEYIIVNAFSGQALDSFWAGNPGDKTTTYLYVPTESEQHWRLEAVAGEPDVYRIRSMLAGSSNMYLDVEGSSGENGAMFQIYTGNNSVAQKFKIIKKQDNSFVILSACSNYTKCADAQYEQGSKIVLSQKVRQNTYDATNPAGRVCWYFIPVEKTEAKTIVTEATYTDNQNFLSTLKDQRGNTTSYTYDQIRGTLTSVTDARGKITSYTYDKKINVITGVSSGSMAVSYAYENDRLKTINVNDSVKYSFGYDGFGRTTSTKVGNGSSWRSLSAVQYNTQGLVLKQTYGNGSYVSYAYDSFDRPVSKKYNGSTQGISYGYNNLGWLSSVNDSVNDTRTSYTYDLAGRVAGSDTVQGTAGGYMRTYSRYVYEDKTNRLSEYNVRMPKSG